MTKFTLLSVISPSRLVLAPGHFWGSSYHDREVFDRETKGSIVIAGPELVTLMKRYPTPAFTGMVVTFMDTDKVPSRSCIAGEAALARYLENVTSAFVLGPKNLFVLFWDKPSIVRYVEIQTLKEPEYTGYKEYEALPLPNKELRLVQERAVGDKIVRTYEK